MHTYISHTLIAGQLQLQGKKRSVMERERYEVWEDNQGATGAFKLHLSALTIVFQNSVIFLYYTVQQYMA